MLSLCMSSAYLFPFSDGCCVNTLYKLSLREEVPPVGKCFVSKVDDEKMAFAGGTNANKNPTISIVVKTTEMAGGGVGEGPT